MIHQGRRCRTAETARRRCGSAATIRKNLPWLSRGGCDARACIGWRSSGPNLSSRPSLPEKQFFRRVRRGELGALSGLSLAHARFRNSLVSPRPARQSEHERVHCRSLRLGRVVRGRGSEYGHLSAVRVAYCERSAARLTADFVIVRMIKPPRCLCAPIQYAQGP